jgi:hypothetical protein
MPVTRTYACDDCNYEWTERSASRDDPYPNCPQCEQNSAHWIPQPVAINGIKSKAVDIAYSAAEDMGLTNLRDNSREGDIGAIAPTPIQSSEGEQIVRSFVEAGVAPQLAPQLLPQLQNYWGGQQGSINAIEQQARQAVMSGQAAAASQMARAEGNDAFSVLSNAPPMKMNVQGRASMKVE